MPGIERLRQLDEQARRARREASLAQGLGVAVVWKLDVRKVGLPDRRAEDPRGLGHRVFPWAQELVDHDA